jgi:DNA helicase-2/ATP-dependent DNA helicase PcrA
VLFRSFSHVFIDEMQDTYSHQNAIIKSLFDETVIIQRIGDSNQAILNDNQSESSWENSERLKITGSRRFSQSIAHILKTVAVKGDPSLTGTNNMVILPHIISYQIGNEPNALEKFVSLIHLFGLDDDEKFKYPIKAVGWVGKEKEGLTLCTYYKPFCKNLKTIKSLNNLRSAVSLYDVSDPKKLQNVIIDCCLEILQLSGIKKSSPKGLRSYTKTSFYNLLKQNYPEALLSLNINIAKCGKRFATNKSYDIIPSIRSYFKDILYPTLNFTINKKGIEFIDSDIITEVNKDQLKSKNIFYSEQVELKHIPVEIATIHSVKGETHRATLYLETYFHKTCGEYLMDQLTGITYNGQGGKRKEMCLRIAHVGMSRPTHLLCVALNEKIVSKNKNALENNNWIII